MEKVRPLCSQPSNRGRLKNITEHYYYIFALHNHHAKNNNAILTASRTQKCVMDTTTFFLFSLSFCLYVYILFFFWGIMATRILPASGSWLNYRAGACTSRRAIYDVMTQLTSSKPTYAAAPLACCSASRIPPEL